MGIGCENNIMNELKIENLKKVVRSTLHLVMLDEKTQLPATSGGSGCIINYRGKNIFLTVQHVKKEGTVTCIDTGVLSSDGISVKLYHINTMFELESFKISKDSNIDDVEKNEVIDFLFAFIDEDIDIHQNKISFEPHFNIEEGFKEKIITSLTDFPTLDSKFSFYGRVKACLYKDTLYGTVLDTTDVFYDGLVYNRKEGHLYIFDLPNSKQEREDFVGTSGAPIFDSKGNLIALVKGNNGDVKTITGLALVDFKPLIDCAIDNEELYIKNSN